MKLYVFPFAPNPRKVLVYVREKGIDCEFVHVDIAAGEHRAPEFLAKNPMGALPVLELDDGSILTESLAIIEYLEELHPDPPMIGDTPLARARVRELERLVEMSLLGRVARIFRNTFALFAKEHIPEVAARAKAELPGVLRAIDARIDGNPFAAGNRPTIADCTLFATRELAAVTNLDIDWSVAPKLERWYDAFRERPSTAAEL